MKSTIKTAAKVVEELNQFNENSGTQRRRHTANRSTITGVFKEKWESKGKHHEYIRSTDRQLTGEDDTSYGCQVGI